MVTPVNRNKNNPIISNPSASAKTPIKAGISAPPAYAEATWNPIALGALSLALALALGGCAFHRTVANEQLLRVDKSFARKGETTWLEVMRQLGPPVQFTIDTPANRAAMPDADTATWTTPTAIARVMAFLLSSESAAVTGALVPVDGPA